MNILKIAAQIFLDKSGSGSGLDADSVASALKNLLPGDGGDLNIASLVSQLGSGGLTSMVDSWLGDGDNDAVSGSGIADALGSDKISTFASVLGMDSGQATEGLAGMIPELINQSSSGGSLLDSVGGAAGLAGFAKKLF